MRCPACGGEVSDWQPFNTLCPDGVRRLQVIFSHCSARHILWPEMLLAPIELGTSPKWEAFKPEGLSLG